MFLLDTDTVSQATKLKPNPFVISWLDSQLVDELCISVITLFELRSGIETLPFGNRRDRLANWLMEDILTQFQGRIVPVSERIALDAAALFARSRRQGLNISTNDPLLAATARVHNLTLATLNRKHFQNLDVPLVDF